MSQPTSKIAEIIPEQFTNEDNLYNVEILDQNSEIKNERAVELNNPFDFDPNRFAIAESAPTLERFLSLTEEIITKESSLSPVKLIEEYPLERLDLIGDEVIGWRLISRKPGAMSTDGKSRIQKSFNYAYRLRSIAYPDKVITIESRPIDHIIEFSCWAKRARVANARALWLERMLINNTWAYQAQGVDRFLWEERLADTFYNISGQALYQRPIRFFVRLYEFRAKADPAISHITYQVSNSDHLKSENKSIL